MEAEFHFPFKTFPPVVMLLNLIPPSHKMKLSLVQKLGIQHKSRAVSSKQDTEGFQLFPSGK